MKLRKFLAIWQNRAQNMVSMESVAGSLQILWAGWPGARNIDRAAGFGQPGVVTAGDVWRPGFIPPVGAIGQRLSGRVPEKGR